MTKDKKCKYHDWVVIKTTRCFKCMQIVGETMKCMDCWERKKCHYECDCHGKS